MATILKETDVYVVVRDGKVIRVINKTDHTVFTFLDDFDYVISHQCIFNLSERNKTIPSEIVKLLEGLGFKFVKGLL